MSNDKPFSWSYSRLTSWELCPSKFEYDSRPTNKGKDGNEASDYGKEVHKKFENYVRSGDKLPLDLQHHTPYLDRVRGMGEPLAEQKLAITRGFQPTGWFDSDVWCRAIIDYCGLNSGSGTAVIIDYKTGKRRLVWEQVYMQAAMLHCYGLDISGLVVGYYWTKEKKFDIEKLLVTDIPAVWSKLLPRVERMEVAVAAKNFPPQQNFLCGRYCGNKTCRYWGK